MGFSKVLVLGAAGAVFYLGTHHTGITLPTATSATSAVSSSSASGGTLSCTGLEHLWESQGGSPSAAFMAAEIATAESSGDQYSQDDDSDGSVDRGYWQINSTWGDRLSTYDPAGNARAAIQISHNGTDWQPWVTYQTGAYGGKC